MKKYNIAIAVNLVDDVLYESNKILEILDKEYGINYIKNHQPILHIALCSGLVDVDNMDFFLEKIKPILGDMSKFTLSLNGMGIFLGDEVNLHIRWLLTKNLVLLKNNIEKSLFSIWEANRKHNNQLYWLPKTSVAYRDLTYQNFNKINFDNIRIDTKCMDVKEISVIKFEENKKEEIIKILRIE